ncbi:MAG: phosphomannomutase/phosphoglucomutase [Angelakisella sp.]|nr:phosphomannomutase/phosphoglucomutase [Angelakisella sp.]
MTEYAKLQNGSDIRGVALPLAAQEPVNLTEEAVEQIARAFAVWLAQRTGRPAAELTIAVGRDSRLSGPSLQRAVLTGLTAMGATAADCGMASTPAMFMATVLPGCGFDGAVMITASHLPQNRNGLKFFTAAGGLESAEIRELLRRAEEGPQAARLRGRLTAFDILTPYTELLRQRIIAETGGGERPLTGLKIAVDAGNGAGGFFATRVLAPLGADISASVFLEPDGSFPNHIPNPENREAMESLRRAVLAGGCDLGLIFDTDVDRAGAMEADGTPLDRNRLIALAAAIAAEQAPGSTIVTDSVTSDQLTEFIEKKLGCRHHRFKRGYKNVINEAIRLNEAGETCLLAMETSGHGALKENYFLDDGAYLATKIVIRYAQLRRQGRTLADLLEGMREPLEARELRFRLLSEDCKAAGAAVLEALARYAAGQPGWSAAPENYEGLRYAVPAQKGWFLLRMSLHDPLMPLNIESDCPGGVDEILRELTPFLRGQAVLDTAALE